MIQKAAKIAQCLKQLLQGKRQNTFIGYFIVWSRMRMRLITIRGWGVFNIKMCMRINFLSCCSLIFISNS